MFLPMARHVKSKVNAVAERVSCTRVYMVKISVHYFLLIKRGHGSCSLEPRKIPLPMAVCPNPSPARPAGRRSAQALAGSCPNNRTALDVLGTSGQSTLKPPRVGRFRPLSR